MPSTLNRDALHSELPTDCVSANVVVDLNYIQYPGISGTGFFVKRNCEVFYITALHCMRANPGGDPPRIGTLMVPYHHTGSTISQDDFIQVNIGFTVGSSALDDCVDLIAFPVGKSKLSQDFDHLVARCAKLPASSAWLEDYMASEHGRRAIDSGKCSAYAIGHPQGSPKNAISYADEGGESIISTEAVVLEGRVTKSTLDGHLAFQCDPSPYGFSGFSGAPVFVPIKTHTGQQFALLGMAVCGSMYTLNLLPLGRLLEAIASDV